MIKYIFAIILCFTWTNFTSAQSNTEEWLKQPIYAQIDLIELGHPPEILSRKMTRYLEQLEAKTDPKEISDLEVRIEKLAKQMDGRTPRLIAGRVAELWRSRPGNVGPTKAYYKSSPMLIIADPRRTKLDGVKIGDFLHITKFKYLRGNTEIKEKLDGVTSDPRFEVPREESCVKHLFYDTKIKVIDQPNKWSNTITETPWFVDDPALTRKAKLGAELVNVVDYVYKPQSVVRVRLTNNGDSVIKFALITFSVVDERGDMLERKTTQLMQQGGKTIGATQAYVRDLGIGKSVVSEFIISKKYSTLVKKVEVAIRALE